MKQRRLKKTIDVDLLTGKEIVADRPAPTPDSSEAASIVSANKHSAGKMDFDDLGNARWKWLTEDQGTKTTEQTFNYMKALETDALSFAEEPKLPEEAKPKTGGGYNPYDIGSANKKR